MTMQQPSLTNRPSNVPWELDHRDQEGVYWRMSDGETFVAYDQVSGGEATFPVYMMTIVQRKVACRCSDCQYVSAFEKDVQNHINHVSIKQMEHSTSEAREATRKDDRVYECTGCEASFRTKRKAEKHISKFRDIEPKRHKRPQPMWIRQYGPSPPELVDEDQGALVQPFPDRPGENRSQQQGASGRRKRGKRGGRKR